MAEVSITINARSYDISCDPGQEGRIVDLANFIDQRVQQIARSGGAWNEAHLLVLATLVLADELFEAKETSKPAGRTAQAPAAGQSKEEEQILVRVLDQLTKRIDGIAAKVQDAA
jgi:cell division protein ZapA